MLAIIGGQPMVERVWRAVVAAGCFRQVVVATDDARVASVAARFGAEVVRTGPAASGTARAALVAPDDAGVVCIQADQPFLDPAHLRALCANVPPGGVATLAAPLRGDVDDPALVKVAVADDHALDFSRRRLPLEGPWLVHVGVYGFAPGCLRRCVAIPRAGRAEQEDLEQLAWLDAGVPIRVVVVDRAPAAVDTPGQLLAARAHTS